MNAALQAMDYEGYLLLHGGHERFPAFLKIEHLLPDKDYWKCLGLAWENIEVSAPDQREWLRLFKVKRPHRKLLMSVADRRKLAVMPETLTIYRGYRKALHAVACPGHYQRNGRSFLPVTPRPSAALY